MIGETLTVLDPSGAGLDPPVTVTGLLTVAQQPRPWQMPEQLDPGQVPTHTLAVSRADTAAAAIKPLRYLEAADGRRWRVMGPVEMSQGLDPGVARWRLRQEGDW